MRVFGKQDLALDGAHLFVLQPGRPCPSFCQPHVSTGQQDCWEGLGGLPTTKKDTHTHTHRPMTTAVIAHPCMNSQSALKGMAGAGDMDQLSHCATACVGTCCFCLARLDFEHMSMHLSLSERRQHRWKDPRRVQECPCLCRKVLRGCPLLTEHLACGKCHASCHQGM